MHVWDMIHTCVCCDVNQCVAVCVAVCCNVLKRVAVCCSVCCSVCGVNPCVAVCVTVCCSVCYSVLQCVLQCAAVCVAVCCSVLQCVIPNGMRYLGAARGFTSKATAKLAGDVKPRALSKDLCRRAHKQSPNP